MANLPKEYFEAYFEYGTDILNRRIFLDGEITTESAASVKRALLYLDTLDNEKPIELWVSSEGGDQYGMFAIYDALQLITCPIHTVATGSCLSAAPLIVAAGTIGYRYATENCTFMVHDAIADSGDMKVEEQKKLIDHYLALNKKWSKLMAVHTKLSEKQWARHVSKVGDYYFDAHKAVDYGVVDSIWSERDGE